MDSVGAKSTWLLMRLTKNAPKCITQANKHVLCVFTFHPFFKWLQGKGYNNLSIQIISSLCLACLFKNSRMTVLEVTCLKRGLWPTTLQVGIPTIIQAHPFPSWPVYGSKHWTQYIKTLKRHNFLKNSKFLCQQQVSKIQGYLMATLFKLSGWLQCPGYSLTLKNVN
jgi:hypothetical protein